MIYYDVTKMRGARQKSGLTRVSSRLLQELGDAVTPVSWDEGFRELKKGSRVQFKPGDWLLTVELFSEAERPGFAAWLAARECRLAAVFHDAIPLRFPHVTWPQSVQRHPGYMKLLAGFDQVLAVSEASRRDLVEFWHWQGVVPRAQTATLGLGADFDGSARMTEDAGSPSRGAKTRRPSVLCVGILEPRKNQLFLLDVVQELWTRGVDFDLHLVGRMNPHFGGPVGKRIRQAARGERRLRWHAAVADAVLSRLYSDATVVAFPTMAEGCGLPLREALWRGAPCLCSDLPVLRENADSEGCVLAAVNDHADWVAKLGSLLADAARGVELRSAARQRWLPRWQDTAQMVLAMLR